MLSFILAFPEKNIQAPDSPQISLGFGNNINDVSPLTHCMSYLEPNGPEESPPPVPYFNENQLNPESPIQPLPDIDQFNYLNILSGTMSGGNSPLFAPSISPDNFISMNNFQNIPQTIDNSPNRSNLFYTSLRYENNMKQQPQLIPQHTIMDELSQDDETKRRKRLEKNRESARQSRSKKKEKHVLLEEKLKNLISNVSITRRKYINQVKNDRFKEMGKNIDIMSQYLALNKAEELAIFIRDYIETFGPVNSHDSNLLYDCINRITDSILPIYSHFQLWLSGCDYTQFKSGEKKAVGTLGGDVGIRFTNKLQNTHKNDSIDSNENIWCQLVTFFSLTAEQEMKLRLDLNGGRNSNIDKKKSLYNIYEYNIILIIEI